MVKITEQRKPLGSVINGTQANATYCDGSTSCGFWSGFVPTREAVEKMKWTHNPAPANLDLVFVDIVEF